MLSRLFSGFLLLGLILISTIMADPSCVTGSCSTPGTGMAVPVPTLMGQQPLAELQAAIDTINTENAAAGMNWTAGVTSVSFLSAEEKKRLLGRSTPKPGNAGEFFPNATIPIVPDLPTSFDWRNAGGDWTTPVKNQGGCGSCYAFAAIGILESYLERLEGNPGMNPDLAEQYLVSCDGDDDGCYGGLFYTALPYLVNKSGLSGGIGTVNEVCFPYVASEIPCINLSGVLRYTADSWNYANTSTGPIHPEFSVPSEAEIKSAIYSKGPVAVGMCVPDSFFDYTTGIYEDHETYLYTDHAVILVGWGEETGKKYYIGKNSWGTGWGEDGWFRIETNSCRIGEGTCFFDSPVFSRPNITGVFPPSGVLNSTIPLLTITGEHFSETDIVELNRTGEIQILDANLSGTNLTVENLSLKGFTPGVYNLIVTNTSFDLSGMKEAAFMVLPDEPGPKPVIHEITATSAGPGYCIPSGSVLAAHGTNQTIQVRSKPGAMIGELRIDDQLIPLPYGTSHYTQPFTNITTNHTIGANHQVMDKVLIADFTINTTGGQVPLTVQCNDTTQGIPDQWYWTFGDGSSATWQNPEHTYARAGTYDIKLWVRNAHASSSVIREAAITATEAL